MDPADIEDSGQTLQDGTLRLAPRELTPYLTVVSGRDAGRRFELNRPVVTVGRSSSADIAIDDARISRVHCAFLRLKEVITIEDRDSRNGTFVDGKRIVRQAVSPASVIQIGETVMHIEYKSASALRLEDELLRRATTDPVTGVFNREHFERLATQELESACRAHSPTGIVMIDLDRFKTINDTFGHQAGDYILARVAHAVRGQKRVEDLLGRYGGDELIVMLRGDVSQQGAAAFCERIRGTVESYPFEFGGRRIPATVSLGLSFAGGAASRSLEEMIGRADKALYLAKDSGRNCTKVEILVD